MVGEASGNSGSSCVGPPPIDLSFKETKRHSYTHMYTPPSVERGNDSLVHIPENVGLWARLPSLDSTRGDGHRWICALRLVP